MVRYLTVWCWIISVGTVSALIQIIWNRYHKAKMCGAVMLEHMKNAKPIVRMGTNTPPKIRNITREATAAVENVTVFTAGSAVRDNESKED